MTGTGLARVSLDLLRWSFNREKVIVMVFLFDLGAAMDHAVFVYAVSSSCLSRYGSGIDHTPEERTCRRPMRGLCWPEIGAEKG